MDGVQLYAKQSLLLFLRSRWWKASFALVTKHVVLEGHFQIVKMRQREKEGSEGYRVSADANSIPIRAENVPTEYQISVTDTKLRPPNSALLCFASRQWHSINFKKLYWRHHLNCDKKSGACPKPEYFSLKDTRHAFEIELYVTRHSRDYTWTVSDFRNS